MVWGEQCTLGKRETSDQENQHPPEILSQEELFLFLQEGLGKRRQFAALKVNLESLAGEQGIEFAGENE